GNCKTSGTHCIFGRLSLRRRKQKEAENPRSSVQLPRCTNIMKAQVSRSSCSLMAEKKRYSVGRRTSPRGEKQSSDWCALPFMPIGTADQPNVSTARNAFLPTDLS